MPTIFFGFGQIDQWTRDAIMQRIDAGAERASDWKLSESFEDADFHIEIESDSLLEKDWMFSPRKSPQPYFVWNTSDLPTGAKPGLYCSLPSSLYDQRRHRTFCYNVRYNEQVRKFPRADAFRLYSFVGGVTSGLRGRMVNHFAENECENYEFRVQDGPWNSMFDRSGLDIKSQYAESLRRSKFILCPRGNGISSIRLFEAMEAQRVPVILSDRFVPPEGIDWNLCSVRVQEKDYRHIEVILREIECNWEDMAVAARRAWERNFSPSLILENMGTQLQELQCYQPISAKAKAFVEFGRCQAKIFGPKLLNAFK